MLSSSGYSRAALHDEEDREEQRLSANCCCFHYGCKWPFLEKILLATDLNLGWYASKWMIPGFTFLLSFFIQNLCLHIATYWYVNAMIDFDFKAIRNVTLNKRFYGRIEEGSLLDPMLTFAGYHDIATPILDSFSAVMAALWLILVVRHLNLQLFTKCCICGSILALTKGAFSIITVIPDSGGWDGCKRRLGEVGLQWFLKKPLDVHDLGLVKVSLNLLDMELRGTWNPDKDKMEHVRYCADMMYSGHTYFTTLFAFGFYDCISKVYFERRRMEAKDTCRVTLAILLSAYVLADVVAILMNRFHYTIDCIVAVFLTYLLYACIPVSRMSMFWANELWIKKCYHRRAAIIAKSGASGDTLVPPCCILPPFCFQGGRYEIRREIGSDSSKMEQFILSWLRDHPTECLNVLRSSIAYHKGHPESTFTERDVLKQECLADQMQKAICLLETSKEQITWESMLQNTPDGAYDQLTLLCGCTTCVFAPDYRRSDGTEHRSSRELERLA